ncbi:MAG: exosortase/archaeosortase family protein [Cyanobacteriota bacterium]
MNPTFRGRALSAQHWRMFHPRAMLRRWQTLDNRCLWQGLAAALAIYLSALSLLTQPPDEAINVVLVLGGALLVCPAFPEGWQPRPGRVGRWVGVTLLVAVLWRGQRMMGFDFVSSALPLLAGLGLVWLAAPLHQLRRFGLPLGVLAVLPVMRAVGWLTPLGPLSLLTAWLAEKMLIVCGTPVLRAGTSLRLEGGAVDVGGPCAGLNMVLQLLVVAGIFAIAFPMRHRWQNGLMLVVAPLTAVLINAMRIVLLAWINASSWPNKDWWFDFFHWHWGSLVFAGLAMQLFVWLYVYWMARQVAALPPR